MLIFHSHFQHWNHIHFRKYKFILLSNLRRQNSFHNFTTMGIRRRRRCVGISWNMIKFKGFFITLCSPIRRILMRFCMEMKQPAAIYRLADDDLPSSSLCPYGFGKFQSKQFSFYSNTSIVYYLILNSHTAKY